MRLKRTLFAFLCLALCLISLRSRVGNAQSNPVVIINIDAAANRHAVNPYIYGVAWASSSDLADLNCPLNRSGGNNTSRYNWQLNADNRGNDWYYESLAYNSATQGEQGDTFIADAKAAGAQPMLTIPMIGWVAKVGAGRGKLSSFSISKYGAQTGNDWQWFADAGNGVKSNGQFVTGNDPNDANVPADSQFQSGWMQHLTSKWGAASGSGLRYYLMDNEPSIWFSTHRDVHPVGPTMDEIRDKIIDYASKVKANDSSALVVAPEEWGWSGYLYSGYDQQYGSLHGWSNLPDRANHGGQDYLPWLLSQLRQHDSGAGKRLLDVFSVHYYPQGGEALSDDVSSAMQLRRNRSTRSLWDPNYVDESWINSRVRLIPRLREWVDAYYPGTQIAITEYNWGAEGHINGATAQADIFGIFGREGLDIGARWTIPAATTPTYKAMKMYRNYDGNRSTFGDVSVSDTVPDPDSLSSFAAIRSSDGALTVMIINKSLSGAAQANINLANFNGAGVAQVWQLTSANAITRLNDLSVAGNSLSLTVPSQSITLLVIAASAATPTPMPTPTPASTPTPQPTPSAPVLYTEGNSQRALALDSVTLMRDPFTLNATQNFSADHRLRILLLAGNVELNAGESASVVTAQAMDSQNQSYPLTVEFVGKVPGFAWLTQVVVKLPDQLANAGDVWVSISLRGIASNKAFVTTKP